MRKWKMAVCAILMLAVTASGLYATASRQATTGEPWRVARSSFNPSSFARAAANYTISILTLSFDGSIIANTHPAFERLQQHTGYRIRLEYVLNANYNEQMNTRLAANDLPGLVVLTGNTSPIITAAQSGAFWDITDIYDMYPNLSRANRDVMNNISIGGRVYGIYRERVMARGGMVYRSDWLRNVGLQEPRTLNDLYNVLRAFTQNDPDRNGQNDTYGMTIAGGGGTGYLGPVWDIIVMHGAPWRFGVRNGRLTPWFEYTEFFEGLDYSKRLYDDGLINRDFAALPTSEWALPIGTNRAGWHIDVADEANRTANRLRDNGFITAAAADAGDHVWVMGSVANARGQIFSRAANTGNQGYVAISTTGARTVQDLHYYLDFLDKTADEIGQNLLNNGAEGVNYTRNTNGTITPIPAAQIPNNWNVIEGWNQFRTLSDKNYTQQLNPRQVRQEEVYLENAQHVVVDPTVPLATSSATWNARQTSLNQIIDDAIINYMIGNINRDGFQREVQRWYSDGGQTALNELQAAYDAARR